MPEHLAIPFGYDATGSASTLRQDSVPEISQCVRVLLSTPTGTRPEVADYGIPDPTFTDATTLVPAITAAVQRWEPRASGIEVAIATSDDGTTGITARIPQEHR